MSFDGLSQLYAGSSISGQIKLDMSLAELEALTAPDTATVASSYDYRITGGPIEGRYSFSGDATLEPKVYRTLETLSVRFDDGDDQGSEMAIGLPNWRDCFPSIGNGCIGVYISVSGLDQFKLNPDTFRVHAPEPGAAALFGIGAGIVALRIRRPAPKRTARYAL